MKRYGSGYTRSGQYLLPRSENAEFLAYGRATGVLLITKARSDYRMQVGRQSHLFLMGFETNGRLIKSISYASEKVRPQSRSPRGMRSSHWRWHLDEVFVKINGERHYLWRAVDHEGEVLESSVTKTRDKKSALKFLKKTLKRHGRPDEIVTDRLRSYGAALRDLGIGDRQETGRWANNRAENSHQPFRRRERAMLRFRRMRTLQKFASVHASVYNHFNRDRALYSRQNFKANRAAALAEWSGFFAA